MKDIHGSLISDYRQFIASKGTAATAHGFTVANEWPSLFPHQLATLQFACEKGRSAAFLDTGLGKSRVEAAAAAEFLQASGKPSLILTPLAVARQMQRECEAIGIDARVIREQSEARPGVNIANYERLPKLDPSTYGGVVLDECFAKGTPVTVVDSDGGLSEVRIETIQVGDRILNAAGVDHVSDVHRRPVPYAVRITVGSAVFVCSPNHPIFTQRGWTPAQCLQPGDQALVTAAAMRLVREGLLPEIPCSASRSILRSILFSEMADEPAGDPGEGSFARSGGKARREEVGMVSVGRSEGRGGALQDRRPQSHGQAGGAREDLPPIESHEARTFRAWGQWDWANSAAGVHAGCAWRRLDSGISFVAGSTDTGLSDALQARSRTAGEENRRRGGWHLAPRPEGQGCEEGRETGLAWVDRLEILEPGHPDLEGLRDANGKLYFYDLGGTRHPSFTVCGLLVHNSSILKSFSGPTKRMLCDAFSSTPYRLAATATPAPNDHMELGNHSEFLGLLGSMEMLCRWFVNDTSTASQNWRLKGHAQADFWRWVSSWSRTATLPSDLGGKDDGFVLPPLDYELHTIAADITKAVPDGMLFRIPDGSATTIHREKRLTMEDRVARAAEIANTSTGAVIVWCETNDESTALAASIPDAIEVHGSMDLDAKVAALDDFTFGRRRVIVSKPKLAGLGLNWQHANTVIFASISHSYEQHYQAVRRAWRYGQTKSVMCHVIISDTETSIWNNVQRKARDHAQMKRAMADAMNGYQQQALKKAYTRTATVQLPTFLK